MTRNNTLFIVDTSSAENHKTREISSKTPYSGPYLFSEKIPQPSVRMLSMIGMTAYHKSVGGCRVESVKQNWDGCHGFVTEGHYDYITCLNMMTEYEDKNFG